MRDIEKLQVLSLFSGVGAFEKSLANKGYSFDLIGFSEIDKYAIESYSAIHNVDKNLNLGSVIDTAGEGLPQIDLLTHGSPCQSFSMAGKQEGGDEGSDTKSSLMWETVRIIQESMPKYIVWENVKNVLSRKHKHNFDKYIAKLNELGYESHFKILNADDYGIPQNRERALVVSIRKDLNVIFDFPKTISLERSIGDYVDEFIDEKYIVPEKVMQGYRNKKSVFKNRFIIKDLSDIAYCLVAKSGRAVITNNYLFADFNLYKNKPCENNDLDYIVDNNISVRSLTPLEYWRLQGYDDEDFYKAKNALNNKFHKGKDKSDAQLYKQAGNSICVPVLEAVFESLFGNKYRNNIPNTENRESLLV